MCGQLIALNKKEDGLGGGPELNIVGCLVQFPHCLVERHAT